MKGTAPHHPAIYRPAVLLGGGFIAGAVAIYALVWVVGDNLIGSLHVGALTAWVGAAAMAAFLAIDLGIFGLSTPMWRRQTPRHWYPRFGADAAGLLWGLDAGLVATTIRVTSLSWAGLSIVLLGLTPWWSGLAYGLGFVLPLAISLVVPRANSAQLTLEPLWLLERLHAAEHWMRRAGYIVLAVGSAACVATALGSL